MRIVRAPQREPLKVLLCFVAVFFVMVLSSCDQSPLSKENIRKSLLERGERNKQPLMIDSISDVQMMTLHGEKCSTAMAYVKGPLGISVPIYFVCKQGHQDYISGGGDLIKEIDKKGYDAVLAEVPKENSDDSSPAPTPSATAEAETPAIPAPTPDERQALADDDKSDLSHCSDDDLTVVAQLAAKSYLKGHPRVYTEADRDLSIRVGMQHNLLGDSLFSYRREWLDTITALSRANPEGAAEPSLSTPAGRLTADQSRGLSSSPTPEPTVERAEPVGIATPISSPTPSPTPLAQSTPTPETVVMRAEPVATPTAEAYAFIAKIQTAFDNHDWRTITAMTADAKVNYFGHRHASNAYISRDMQNDAVIYSSAKSTSYPETFTHDLSDPSMIYDSINVYSDIQERNGRLHKALVRLTVGYRIENGVPVIYAIVQKVLSQAKPAT